MRHYRWIALTGGIGIAAALFLYAAKTDGMNVMTGPKAFTNTASLSPGLARKITAQDLPQSRPLMVLPRLGMYLAAGFTRGGARPESAIPKAPAGFKLNIYVASGLTIPRQMLAWSNATKATTIRLFIETSSENWISRYHDHRCKSFVSRYNGRFKDLPQEMISLFRSLQPFKGGNDLLWALNKLCVVNKHKMLAHVAVMGRLNNSLSIKTNPGFVLNKIRLISIGRWDILASPVSGQGGWGGSAMARA
jgi:hypothetical protein